MDGAGGDAGPGGGQPPGPSPGGGRSRRRGGIARRLGAAFRRARWLHGAVAALGAGYIHLVHRTVRWQVEGRDALHARVATTGAIAALWHGRLFLSPCLHPPGKRTVAMISHSGDGDVISRIVAWWEVDTVRGSTYDRAKGRDKGGAQALTGAAAELAAGSVVAITPDGPRGPRRVAQTGSAQLAIELGIPVFPVAFSARPAFAAGSWDRFLVPLPFGRGAIVMGEAITAADVPAAPGEGREGERARVEALTRLIEARLCEVTDRADRLVGRVPEPPAGAGRAS